MSDKAKNEITGKKETIKKIAVIAINSIAGLLCALILLLAIFSILSHGQGYTSYFGYAYFNVRTESMQYNDKLTDYGKKRDDGSLVNDPKLAFNAGDIIQVKILSDADKLKIKEGDVISFWDLVMGEESVNSHRVVRVNLSDDGESITVYTKGDNASGEDEIFKTMGDIIGKYTGKASSVGGKFFMFISSSTGFLVMCVIPAILITLYCLVLLVLSLMGASKEKALAESELLKATFEAEKERLRQELFDQLKNETNNKGNKDADKHKD